MLHTLSVKRPSLKFTDITGQMPHNKATFRLMDDDGEYRLSKTQKIVLETIYENNEVMNARKLCDALKYSMPPISQALKSLVDLGLVDKYTQHGVRSKFFLTKYQADSVSSNLTKIPDRDPIVIDMASSFAGKSYAFKENDPNPEYLETPYIPFYPHTKIFKRLLIDFHRGQRDEFQRAASNVNGVMQPEQGRWVYVGSDTMGEAIPVTKEKRKPVIGRPSRSPDMVL